MVGELKTRLRRCVVFDEMGKGDKERTSKEEAPLCLLQLVADKGVSCGRCVVRNIC